MQVFCVPRVLGCSKRIAWEDHVIFNVVSANLISGWCKIYDWSLLFRSRLLQSWKAPSHLSTWYFKKLSMGWLRDVKTLPTTRWVVTALLNRHAVRVFGYTRCWNYKVDAVTCGRNRLLSWISKEGFVMESRSAENWNWQKQIDTYFGYMYAIVQGVPSACTRIFYVYTRLVCPKQY